MKVKDLLEHLEGAGLTITDWNEMPPALTEVGLTLETNLNEAQWTACESVEEQAVAILSDVGILACLHHTGGGIWVAEVRSDEIANRVVWIVDSEGDQAGPFLVVAYPFERAEEEIESLSGACAADELAEKVRAGLSQRPEAGEA
jgi:hypothetical protein